MGIFKIRYSELLPGLALNHDPPDQLGLRAQATGTHLSLNLDYQGGCQVISPL
jgi:hypothetical protein